MDHRILRGIYAVYILGFNGMTRRLNVADNPEWAPLLWTAAFGVAIIAAGIAVQFWQVFVSIRDRKENMDTTGDPWDGRTLEWQHRLLLLSITLQHCLKFTTVMSTTTAKRTVRLIKNQIAINASICLRTHGRCGNQCICLSVWLCICMAHLVLVIASSIGMVGSWIAYSFQRSKDYFVEVSEVNAIEGEHLAAVERAKKNAQAPQQDDDVSPDDDLKPADATA